MAEGRRRRLFRLFGAGRADIERELDEEIGAHIALRADDLVRSGMDPDAARAEAERRFGHRADVVRDLRQSARRRTRRLSRREMLHAIRSDVRGGVRNMAKAPGFAAVAVLTLALGIGLTTTMVAIVDPVLLRPLSFPESDRLVSLQSVDSIGNEFPWVSMGNWVDWHEQSRSLTATALIRASGTMATVRTGDEAERVPSALVAGPFFDVLRPRWIAGRGFTVEESQSGAGVAVVSERFWRTRLGGARDLPLLDVDGGRVQVVGVIAQGDTWPESAEVWRGTRYAAESGGQRNNVNWFAIGRLEPGVTPASARAELTGIAQRIRVAEPEALYSWGVGVIPLRDELVAPAASSLWLLLGAVGLVLLVACVNLAGLGLARVSGRSGDIAIRLALGARRGRVIQQLVTEGLVPAIAGGALGVVAAAWATNLLAVRLAAALPRSEHIGVDLRVVGVITVVTVLAGVLASIVPAVRISRVPLRSLTGSARGGVRGGRMLPGAALVGAQFALTLILLTTGALLVRSFAAVVSRDLGFEPRGVVTAGIALTSERYAGPDRETRSAYWRELVQRVEVAPGVHDAAVGNWVPGGDSGNGFIEIDGVHAPGAGAEYHVISEDYFAALGIPVLAGRAFEAADGSGTERVVIVSRTLADRYWPAGDALGQRIRALSQEGYIGAPWLRVIGVVGDVRHHGHESDAAPGMYVAQRQVATYDAALTLVVRGDAGSTRALMETVRAAIRDLDPAIGAVIEPLDARMARHLDQRRMTMAVLTVFSGLALGLAALGLYGLIAFAVTQRTREIGVRAALGARQLRIVRMMITNALGVVVVGGAAGLLGSWWTVRLMRGLLVDVAPLDPIAWIGALGVMVIVSIAAALVPSLRAARIDPLEALRAL